MADVLSVLRGQLSEAEDQVRRLQTAISALEGGGLGGDRVVAPRRRRRTAIPGYEGGSGRKRNGGRRKMSAAARKRISDAQKARWAKQKAAKKS